MMTADWSRADGRICALAGVGPRIGAVASRGFAPAKAAPRILSESIAREFGLRGVRVACIWIDAAIGPVMPGRYPTSWRELVAVG